MQFMIMYSVIYTHMTVSLPKPPTKTTQPTAASTVKAKANYKGRRRGGLLERANRSPYKARAPAITGMKIWFPVNRM